MKKAFVITTILLLTTSLTMADLAGYWNFNEGSGTTVADSSGNSKNGVLEKLGSGAYPAWVTGHDGTGYALNFNSGVTSWANSNRVLVDISSSDKLANIAPVPTQAFTIVMWVKSYGATGESSSYWRHLCYTDAYELRLAIDPNYSVESPRKQDYFYSTNDTNWRVTLGNERDSQWKYSDLLNPPWYHLAITYDGNYLRKYVNGNVIYMTYPKVTRIGLPTATTDFYIGNGAANGFFKGAIDDVAVYKGGYLPRTEVLKLVNGTATPLTVTTSPVEDILPVTSWKMEPTSDPNGDGFNPLYGYIGGAAWQHSAAWKALWCTSFAQDITLSSDSEQRLWNAGTWWINNAMLEGGRSSVYLWNKWFPAKIPTDVNDANAFVENWYASEPDENTHGIQWIAQEYSGRDAGVAVFAAYITPGYAITGNDWGYHLYDPNPFRLYSWENKPYFKTYSRFTTTGAPANCRMLVSLYTFDNESATSSGSRTIYKTESHRLTKYYELRLPILGGDWAWQEFKGALPKPKILGGSYDKSDPNAGVVVFAITIEGGDEDTILFVDEFSPLGNQYLHPGSSNTFLEGDFNRNSIIYFDDFAELAEQWLGISGGIIEPRTGGLLVNGDFNADLDLLPAEINDINIVAVSPTGWTITGSGNYGIRHTEKTGVVNFSQTITAPLGGSISVQLTDMYTDDPYGVLQQTTTATAVNGQTYYAMAYVMTPGWSASYDDWRGWKDTATMNIVIDGTVKATFSRKLSRNVWRPLYGSYTATSTDAGKPITIQISYANTHTSEIAAAGYMLVGNAYLGSTTPEEWPEARENLLTNGGFEDLSNYEAVVPALVQSVRNSDNWGAWFVDGVPAPLGWVFEVPSGFSIANEAGIYASGMYGTPIPTEGMSDVSVYTTNDVKLGQVIGALDVNTTYYFDMACGINNQNYITDTNWPLTDANHLPAFHIELWRIPSGVTSGTTIYNAIAAGNPAYVKIADANTRSTGNIAGGKWDPFRTPSSKWQIIGSQYTATSLDTNIYLRVYGIDGADVNNAGTSAVNPQFAFSDVYVSTEKRLVPGGATSFNIAGGMLGDDFSHIVASHVQKYEVLGPYDCYHAVAMGTNQGDVNNDCQINFVDYAATAENWLQPLFSNISGDPNAP
jgi:hypothetical protein